MGHAHPRAFGLTRNPPKVFTCPHVQHPSPRAQQGVSDVDMDGEIHSIQRHSPKSLKSATTFRIPGSLYKYGKTFLCVCNLCTPNRMKIYAVCKVFTQYFFQDSIYK